MDAKAPEQPETVTYGVRPMGWRKLAHRARNAALVLVALGALALLGTWVYGRFSHVYVDDARITADVISVSSRVSGWVTRLHVSEGQRIKAGDVLVSVDSRDARLQLSELDARLSTLGAERARLETEKAMIDRQTSSHYTMRNSQLEAAKAALAGRKSDLDLARADFERAKALLKRNVVSRQRWEERRSEFRRAEQAFEQAKAEVAAASAALVEASASRQQVLVLDKQIAMLSHQQEELNAQRERQALDLHDRVIRSPIDGVVDKIFVNASEYVSAGQRLLMMHDPDKIWVSANVKETDIRHVRLGAPAEISVDAYPGEVFEGRITRIGNAATSEFALLPTPNPSGNFTKITQRLNLRVAVEQKDGLLRPGMMVEVDIGIHDR